MAGHFPHRPRLWVPHALGLAAMLPAWLPAAQPVGTPLALLTLAAVLVWQLRAGVWPGTADTVAMAALIGLTAVEPGTADMGGMHSGSAAGSTLPYAVAVLVGWALVRRAVRPGGAGPGRSGRVLGALRFGGGLVMLAAMTAMLA
jgi:hypothetical protein